VDRLLAVADSEAPSRLDLSVLGPDVVAFKIWDPNGMVIHSSNLSEVGDVFPIEEGLESAWNGVVSTEISSLDREEHTEQRAMATRLIETYAPIRRPGTGEIAAVIEFYQDVEQFESEIASARRQTWAIVAGLVVAIYLGLVLLVRRGSRTIERQRGELERRVDQSERLLARNTELTTRLKAAARRTTTLNEEYLRRIAADLHDGPAQDIGYALLAVNKNTGNDANGRPVDSLKRALEEIRAVSAGLRSPELESLSLRQVVIRALAVHRNRTGCDAVGTYENLPASVDLAAKITVYRVLLEALSNAHRHGGDCSPKVSVVGDSGFVVVRVSDHGGAAAPASVPGSQRRIHLGLAVMRERVELLGGKFEVGPNQPTGTIIEARIPHGETKGEPEDSEDHDKKRG
jgi:signal transduction histidine kinase